MLELSYDKALINGGWCFEDFVIKDIKDCSNLFDELTFTLAQSLDSVGKVNKQICSKQIKELIAKCGGIVPQRTGRSMSRSNHSEDHGS